MSVTVYILLWDDDNGDGVWEGQSELSFLGKWMFVGHRLQVNGANSGTEKLEVGLVQIITFVTDELMKCLITKTSWHIWIPCLVRQTNEKKNWFHCHGKWRQNSKINK